ncbi:MAG: nucleotidyltransferase domain-containing protein [Oscillospiraceae bacterium]|nr:nucleotidyltransferase domain-containing protein [Oscillospiraceae bacterium]
MAVDIKNVNEIVTSYVKAVKTVLPIEKAYLYGSYAKGTQTEHSDVDMCFFLPSFGSKRAVDIVTDLLTIAAQYPDLDIEPRAFQTVEIERGNPFVKEVLRTGREITINS